MGLKGFTRINSRNWAILQSRPQEKNVIAITIWHIVCFFSSVSETIMKLKIRNLVNNIKLV